jgi:hypothetical protein
MSDRATRLADIQRRMDANFTPRSEDVTWLRSELAAVEARRVELQEKLRSAYAYREAVEGLPPGTLTSKLASGDGTEGAAT